MTREEFENALDEYREAYKMGVVSYPIEEIIKAAKKYYGD